VETEVRGKKAFRVELSWDVERSGRQMEILQRQYLVFNGTKGYNFTLTASDTEKMEKADQTLMASLWWK
jgi:hypothetical protein